MNWRDRLPCHRPNCGIQSGTSDNYVGAGHARRSVSLAGYPKDESPCLLGGVIVQLKPETEQLVQEEIRSGHFHSVDELIVQGINAWREKHRVESITAPPKPHKRLYDLLT